MLSLYLLSAAATATVVSAPFAEGFIGTQGANTQQANNIKLFNTLGIARAYLQQNTDNGRFGGTQGNDYAATLKLVFNNGSTLSIPGNITWRDGANPLHGVGFIPLGTVGTQTITYNTNQTYTLNTTSNYLVQLNTSTKVYTDNSNVSGNAANSGIFDALNAYLDTTISSRPAGPVTVTAQDTYDTTPTVTGTATLALTEDLTVEINGVVYTTSSGLTVDRTNNTWSVTIPNGSALPVATYAVTATIINQSGYVLTDSTTNELRVLSPTASMRLVKTATVSGDVVTYAYQVTNTGALDIHAVTLSETSGSFSGTGTAPSPAIDAAATGTADDDGVLSVGEAWYYTATYTVTQADRDAGTLSNSATVSGLNPSNGAVSDVSDNGNEAVDANGDGQTGNDPTVTALTRSPAMTLVKTSSVSGDTVSYTYVVTNTGNVTLRSVALAESAAGFTGTGTRPAPVIDATATGAADDDGELDVGESWTYTASYSLTQADKDAGSVSNSASVTARDPANGIVSDVSDSGDEAVDADTDGQAGNDPTVTAVTQSPAMSLVKTATVSGRVVTYTYSATNTGNVTLRNVSLGESAAGFSGTGTLPSPAIDASATGTADDDAELDVGETWVWTATYALTDADFLAGSVSNSATVTADDPSGASILDQSDDGDPADSAADADSDGDNDPTETALVMAPHMALVKTATLTATGVTYRYAVTNTGNVGLQNVAIGESAGDFSGTGILPVPVIDPLATGTADDDGILDVGETWVFTADYVATNPDRTAGSISNSATATGEDPSGASVSDLSDNGNALDGEDNPTVTSLTGTPELTLVKTGSVSGGVLSYRYDVTNTGNVSLDTVSVLETASEFSGEGTPPVAALDAGLTGTADDDGTLDPGETWVFTADYTLTQGDIDTGSVTNSATALAKDPAGGDVTDVSDDGDPADSALDNDSDGGNDPTVTTITAAPALRLTKTATADGSDLVYTYVVTNTGNVTLTGIAITETAVDFSGTGTLPVPMVDGVATGTADDDDELDVGESWTYTARYTPTTADRDAGTLSNRAGATATDPSLGTVTDASDDGNEAVDADGDGLPGNDPTETAVPVSPSLTITHALTDLSRRFNTEYAATFRITLTNDGDLTLTGLSLLNDLAAYLGAGNLVGTPTLTKVSGPAGWAVNGSFDGNGNTVILSGESLAPGESGEIDVTFNFLTTGGFPSGNNSATADATELAASVSAEDDLGVTDDDNDGAVDSTESPTADRDGDGIADADDYDPTGYFYCEDDGRILSGGSISVSRAGGGSNSSVGTANNITIAQDGSGGYYQWWVDLPGTYTMTISYPPGTTASTARLVNASALDVSSLPSDPAFLGSTEFGTTGYLADFTQAANPTFYMTFDIEAGDPNVMANNIPVTDCASAAGSVVVTDHDLTTGEESDDTGVMGFALSSAPSGPVTLTFQGDAECRVEPATMTFTAADWATEQQLTIIGRKDDRIEGPHSCTPTVTVSSGDPNYDGLTPTLSTVSVVDGLLDAVEEQVREKLTEDLTRTLTERSAEFRDIAAHAAMRLAEPVPEVCETSSRLDPEGSIDAAGGSLSIDGTINDEGDPCLREGRRIVQSRFALVRNADGSTSADISADFLRETRQSDNRLSGRFFGGYLRLPADQEGSDRIRGIGLHAGIYGAERRANGWASEHYLALGIGIHDYSFGFGSGLSAILATGDYRYAALYGGVALSRDIAGSTFVLTPRIGIDLALGLPQDATITAQQGIVTEDGTIALDPVAVGRLYGEIGIALPDAEARPGQADSDWIVTPSIFCDAVSGGDGGCGVGLALDLQYRTADHGVTWGAKAEIEHSAQSDSLALTLRRTREFETLDGQSETGLGIGPDGDPTATHTINLQF